MPVHLIQNHSCLLRLQALILMVMMICLLIGRAGECFAVSQDKTSPTAFSTISYGNSSVQFQNVTNYYGDLLVNGSETLVINDCEFNITGIVTISDEGQLILSDCKFVSNWNVSEEPDTTNPDGIASGYCGTRQIVVEDRGRLNVSNSEVILLGAPSPDVNYHVIAAYNEAEITMTNSTLSWNGDPVVSMDTGIYLCSTSRLVLTNSSISTFQQAESPETPYIANSLSKNFIFINESSAVCATNSVIDEIFTYGEHLQANSSVLFVNCTGDYVQSLGTSYVWLINSTFTWMWTEVGAAHYWLTNCTIGNIDGFNSQGSVYSLSNTKVGDVAGDGEILLDNSEMNETGVDISVLAVWHLPLFGTVLVPYVWTLYMVPMIILVVATLMGIALVIKMRRQSKRLDLKEDSPHAFDPLSPEY